MDELKNIVATFVKKDPAVIDDNTLINKRVISGSILVHRMYAAINNAGYSIKEYNDINTYGELVARLNGTIATPLTTIVHTYTPSSNTISKATGIDIEHIANFPSVKDFREDDFYKMNFSSQEISYCLLKEKPLESFAGLFAAKEALCKANERIRSIAFNQIEIKHDDNGRPTYPGYSVSISHTDQVAVAVAIADEPDRPIPPVNTELASLSDKYDTKINALRKLTFLSFFIALSAIIVAIVILMKA